MTLIGYTMMGEQAGPKGSCSNYAAVVRVVAPVMV
jgi:hypothetical protein